LLENEKNLGLFLTRNRGIEEARGEYFATLDCDDIATKKRLELQLKYFHENKDAVVCAGRIKYIDHNSKSIGHSAPLRGDKDYFKALFLFTNIFINSATMSNTAILKELMYREGYEPAEDYDLFERIAAENKIGIINDVLCYYRVHNNNVSTVKSYNRKIGERKIIERQLRRYGFKYTEDDLDAHLKFTSAEFDFANVESCSSWFNSLAEQNSKKKIFNDRSFKLALARQWLRLCFYRLKKKHDLKPFLKKGVITYSHLFHSFINSV
jgi:glycosyltransferase involved in cell wall biosynthesis